MTKTTTIRVSKATSERLNELKAKYGFKSANELLMIALTLLEKILGVKNE